MGSPCGAEGVGLKICPLPSCTRAIESHWLVSLGLGRKRGATGSKISAQAAQAQAVSCGDHLA